MFFITVPYKKAIRITYWKTRRGDSINCVSSSSKKFCCVESWCHLLHIRQQLSCAVPRTVDKFYLNIFITIITRTLDKFYVNIFKKISYFSFS